MSESVCVLHVVMVTLGSEKVKLEIGSMICILSV